MKLVIINKTADAVTSTILHGVTVPAQFASESERIELLTKVMDMRDDDKLTGPQARELRTKIMATPVKVVTDADGVKRAYIRCCEDLYGTFNMTTGRSEGGTADLLKDWNKASTYDCGDALFQLITGIMKLLCYESKDMTSTIFNSAIKRAVNNIKSDLVSFRTNSGSANTTVGGDRSTLSESQLALSMICDRIDVLIDISYQTLELINGSCEALGGAITLENIRKQMKAEAEAMEMAKKANAEAQLKAETKPVEQPATVAETKGEPQGEPEPQAAESKPVEQPATTESAEPEKVAA